LRIKDDLLQEQINAKQVMYDSGILEIKYKVSVFQLFDKLPQNICKNVGEIGFPYFNCENQFLLYSKTMAESSNKIPNL